MESPYDSPKRQKRLIAYLVLVILIVIGISFYVVIKLEKARVEAAKLETARKTCRGNMQVIANAEAAHKVESSDHQYIAIRPGENMIEAGLVDLIGHPACPAHGQYSVELEKDGSITVHCSIAAHDDNGQGGRGFKQGRDSE